ncbi:MAG: ATP-binding protein [Phaeodactylibacter sp.]|uniref:sensor histidine kinase n=1 Tax=Phaeodactylibacter sp. TaxID=1940289 RepID=UPI0032EE6345
MYKKLRPLNWVSQLGVTPDLDRVEIARIVILNRLNLAGAVVATVVGVKDILSKGLELTILLPILLFFIGELLLSAFRYHTIARYAANIILPLLMTTSLLMYGAAIGAGYTLFVFITTAIIFHKNWLTRISLITFIILLFSGSSIALLSYTPPLSYRIDSLDSIITFIGTSLAVSLMITYFFHENMKYEEEQTQLMRSLKSSNTALQKANAELERFAYIASHDLKTPVRNISSFIGLAERDLQRGQYEQLGEYFRYVKTGAYQLNALIEDILDFSRLNQQTALDFEPTDLNAIISDCTDQLRGVYGDTFTINAPNLPIINTAPHLLTILCMNLLDNAIKYNTSTRPTIEITARQEETEWLLTFSDNGIGIPTEFQEKVFDMFQRLHPPSEYSGTGIGLAMCKKVTERLSGDIKLQSVPGQGSRFFVRLPQNKPIG